MQRKPAHPAKAARAPRDRTEGVAQPFLAGLSGSIRENPLPWAIGAGVAALTGLGLAYKYWSRRYTYREIRDKYDRKLGLERRAFVGHGGRVDVDCNELARSVNRQSQTAIAMMQDVQYYSMGCSFRFVPATKLIVELKKKIGHTRVHNFEDRELFRLFCGQVELLHTTGGATPLTAFLVAKIQEKNPQFAKPDTVNFANDDTVLVPNYLCQIFIELLLGTDQKRFVKLGSTNELDWILFGNSLSVFFSLTVGKHLKRNNSSQKLVGRKAVLKPMTDFGDECFWIGPDLLGLSKAFELDPEFVKKVVEQTPAPYGTGREIAELFYWQAVAACQRDTPKLAWQYLDSWSGKEVERDFLAAPEIVLEVISYRNRLNTDGLKEPQGKLRLNMQDADKLEVKALGLVPNVHKVPIEQLGIK